MVEFYIFYTHHHSLTYIVSLYIFSPKLTSSLTHTKMIHFDDLSTSMSLTRQFQLLPSKKAPFS